MCSVVKQNIHFLGIFEILALAFMLVLLSLVVQLSMIKFAALMVSLAHSLAIIPHRSAFVKRFFESFFNFFQPLFTGALVDSLHIIAQQVLFVKQFLTIFFTLGFTATPTKFHNCILCRLHTFCPSKHNRRRKARLYVSQRSVFCP